MARKKFNPIPLVTAAVGGLGSKMLLDVLYGVPELNSKPEFPPALLLVAATGADYFVGSNTKTAYINDALKGASGVAGMELGSSLLQGYRVKAVQGPRVSKGRIANMGGRRR